MPRIPKIDPGSSQLSSPQLSTQSPNALQQKTATTGEVLETIGGAVKNSADFLYQKMDEARNYAEKSKKEVYKFQTKNALLTEAENERNPDGSPKTDTDVSAYREKMAKAKEGLSGIFTNKDELARAQAEWDLDTAEVENKVKTIRMKNIALVAKANNENLLEAMELAYDGSKEATDQINGLLQEGVAKNIYDPVEAQNRKEKAIDNGRWNWFRKVAREDRETAKKMLSDGTFGFGGKDIDTALSTLNHYKELEDKQDIITKIDTRIKYAQDVASGKESIYDPSPAMKDFMLRDEVLNAANEKAVKQFSKEKYSTKKGSAASVYLDILDKAAKAENADELSTVIASTIYMHGKTDPDMVGAVLFYANQKAKTLGISEKFTSPIDGTTTDDQIKAKQIDAGLNSIGRWSRHIGADANMRAALSTDYMSRIQKGEKAHEALSSAIKSANMRILPEMVNYPKEGRVFRDALGNYITAYPDGTMSPMLWPKPKTMPKATGSSKSESSVNVPAALPEQMPE